MDMMLYLILRKRNQQQVAKKAIDTVEEEVFMLLSPQRIVLGGGVMHQEHMMPLVREEVKKQLNGYLVTKELEDLDSYIVLPSLNDNQGIMGALKLAVDELAMQ